MADLYFYLFILICAGLFLWGLMRSERAYQYPFFMSCTFISFILPQAYSLVNNPDSVPENALAKVLLMCCLCVSMCWFGYQITPEKKWLQKLNISIDERKLFRIGMFLTLIGCACAFLINNTEAQLADNYNWTGIVTIYSFFSQVIYIALTIFLIQAIKQPSFRTISWSILASVPALIPVVFYARRTPTITVMIIFGLSLWFVKRYVPPRWIFILLVVLGLYAIPLIGQLRENVWSLGLNNEWSALYDTAQESMDKLIEGDKLELRNAAMIIEASTVAGRYGYGAGFWDALVFQYFPGQFFGYDLKESLMLHWGLNNITSVFGYHFANGTTLTGIGDSFIEFNYLGSIIFAVIAYVFKTLWVSANYYKSQLSMLIYIGLLSPALIGITHGINRFIREAVFQILVALFIAYFAKRKVKNNY